MLKTEKGNITLSNYESFAKDMPSLDPSWKPTEAELRANRSLRWTLDEKDDKESYKPGYEPKPYDLSFAEEILLDAWCATKCVPGSDSQKIVRDIEEKIGYKFINEHLCIQALTRRSYTGTISQDSYEYEDLELLGDSILSTVFYRIAFHQYAFMGGKHTNEDGVQFCCDLNEGELTKLKEKYTSKDYLVSRCESFGFEKYIRFGKGDDPKSVNPREDIMEALIGAVTVDSGWDFEVLEGVVEKILDIQLDEDGVYNSYGEDGEDGLYRSSLNVDHFNQLNRWHEKNFHSKPVYKVAVSQEEKEKNVDQANLNTTFFSCSLTIQDPSGGKMNEFEEYDRTDQQTGEKEHVKRRVFTYLPDGKLLFTDDGRTRSKARSNAAMCTCLAISKEGYWLDLNSLHMEFSEDNAINQVQELYQKKYIEKPFYNVYEYDDTPGSDERWCCDCRSGMFDGEGFGDTKVKAKKAAAAEMLGQIIESGRGYTK